LIFRLELGGLRDNGSQFLEGFVVGVAEKADKTVLRLSSLGFDGVPGVEENAVVEAYLVSDNSWKESEIVWGNQPEIGAKLGEGVVSEGGFFDVDLGDWTPSDGTYSIALKTKFTSAIKIHSSEAEEKALGPQLITMVSDSDSDRLHDGWEITHAGDLNSMNESSDTDYDGCKDVFEYVAGTDPNDPKDVFRTAPLEKIDSDHWRIAWPSKEGKKYRIMQSTTLRPDSWEPVNDVVYLGDGSQISDVIQKGNSLSIFYRVEVVVP